MAEAVLESMLAEMPFFLVKPMMAASARLNRVLPGLARRLPAGGTLLPLPGIAADAGSPTALAWSPESCVVAAAFAGAVFVWRRTGEHVATLPVEGRVAQLIFSQDRRRLFAVVDGSGSGCGCVVEWDVYGKRQVASLQQQGALCLRFSPRSRSRAAKRAVIFQGPFGVFATDALWSSLQSERPLLRLACADSPPLRAEFSEDGTVLAALLSSCVVAAWDVPVDAGLEVTTDMALPFYRAQFFSAVSALSVAPDGARLGVTTDTGHLFVVDLKAARARGQDAWISISLLPVVSPFSLAFPLKCEFLLDAGWTLCGWAHGGRVMVGRRPDAVQFRSVEDGRLVHSVALAEAGRLASVSPDGSVMAASCANGVRLVDLSPPPLPLPLRLNHSLVVRHPDRPGANISATTAGAWSPDGTRLLLSFEDGACVLDSLTGDLVDQCTWPSASSVSPAFFWSTGRRVVTFTHLAIRSWNRVTHVVTEEAWPNCILAMSMKGPMCMLERRSLASDREVVVCCPAKHRLYQVFRMPPGQLITRAAFSSDGCKLGFIVKLDAAYSLRVFDVTSASASRCRQATPLYVLTTATLRAFSFSPCGRWILASELSGENCKYVVDLQDLTPAQALEDASVRTSATAVPSKCKYVIPNSAKITDLVWSPKGTYMCCLHVQYADALKLQLRKTANFDLVRVVPLSAEAIQDSARPMAMSPDGRIVACLGKRRNLTFACLR